MNSWNKKLYNHPTNMIEEHNNQLKWSFINYLSMLTHLVPHFIILTLQFFSMLFFLEVIVIVLCSLFCSINFLFLRKREATNNSADMWRAIYAFSFSQISKNFPSSLLSEYECVLDWCRTAKIGWSWWPLKLRYSGTKVFTLSRQLTT